MEFGKIYDLEGVDFRLPPSHQNTKLVLNESINHSLSNVYVGCTGWGMPQWNGSWYPKNTKPKDFLSEYSRQFNTIEHNTTHYRIPDLDTIFKWKNESEAGFKFCPKIPQTISHSQQLGLNTSDIRLFCENILLLGEKLGCAFMQLPPHFGIEKIGILEHFFHVWESQIPLAVELRNDKIFQDEKQSERFFNLFERYNVSTVITDVAGRRDVLHQRLTTSVAMIRFVGNDLHSTDYQRVDEWISLIKSWFDEGLETLYFFSHQPENLKSPEMALYFIEKINEIMNLKIKIPSLHQKVIAEQMSLF
jgi:uncharacterized protein YecE (DUF72 family)